MEKRHSKLYAKYYALGVLCCISLTAQAQRYSMSNHKVQHFVGLRIGTGEANNIHVGKTNMVENDAGVAAGLGFVYELYFRKWSFGLGIDGHYQYLNDHIQAFSDIFPRTDINGEQVMYEYAYNMYRQSNHVAMVSVPFYIGRDCGQWAYIHVGGRFSIPLWSHYSVKTDMYTQGNYVWDILPVRSEGENDFSAMGYYPNQPITYESTYTDYMQIGTYLEVGGYLPLPDESKKSVRLRLGVYGNVNWRIGTFSGGRIADYSAVDTNPHTQSLNNLKNMVRYHALTTTDAYSALPLNLEVGIRLTCLFNVTGNHEECRCESY